MALCVLLSTCLPLQDIKSKAALERVETWGEREGEREDGESNTSGSEIESAEGEDGRGKQNQRTWYST